LTDDEGFFVMFQNVLLFSYLLNVKKFSPTVFTSVLQAVGGQQSLALAAGGSERRVRSALRSSQNAIRAVSSPPSASTPVTVGEGK